MTQNTPKQHRSLLYDPIPAYGLKENVMVEFDLYEKMDHGYVLLLKKGVSSPKKLIERLEQNKNNKEFLYIKKSDKSLYYAQIESYLNEIAANDLISLQEKASLVYKSASIVVQDMFDKPESKQMLQRSKKLVESTIDVVLSDEGSIKTLMGMGSHDYYTYTHSIDVGIYAIGFAKFLGYAAKDIKAIAYGAIMHDIGKSKIPSYIINKTEKLDNEEFAKMKKHPEYSYNILKYHGEEDERVLHAVRHHHEKKEGNGYPDGIKLHQIHPFARIIAICDIFSALTTDRSYKKASTSFGALQLMKKQMAKDLDEKLFYQFIQFIGHSCTKT